MWQLDQIEKLHEIEPAIVTKALKELFSIDAVLREKIVVGAYIDNEISFSKAAEILGLHPVKLRELFLSKGIPVRIGAESKEAVIAEGVAAKEIRKELPH